MFDTFRRAKTTIYDPPIVKVLEAMQAYGQEDSEFATALENLERLTKLKEAEKQTRRVSGEPRGYPDHGRLRTEPCHDVESVGVAAPSEIVEHIHTPRM